METKIASVQTEKSLSVVQFISSNINSFDYLSLGRAANEKMIELLELKEGASVNDILVVNHSDKYVFMMDGDIIEGAKQNRIINTSILLPPNSKNKIQVSCVEQGRWHQSKDLFMPSDFVAPSKMRHMKNEDVFLNLKENKKAYADQSKVWQSVSESQREMDVVSMTENFSDIFTAKEDDFRIFSEKFSADENVNGMALFKGNKFVALDLFNRGDVYAEYFPKIIKGATLQFSNLRSSKNKIDESELKYRTLEILDKIESMEKKRFSGICAGSEDRFEEEKLNGFQLIFRDHLIHLTAMGKN